ncbi:MAG: branched-chain amino acid ABC transporter permease [Planctomycetota bacterium]
MPDREKISAVDSKLESVGGLRGLIARTIIGAALLWAIFTLINGRSDLQNMTVDITFFILMSLGLNVMQGYTGLLNLGYGGFVCIGGYTFAILNSHPGFEIGMSFWLTLPLAFATAALGGILLGIPTLRLSGDYFAIVTFGFGELMRLLANNWVWLTRGPFPFPTKEPNIPFTNILFGSYPPREYLILGIILVIATALFVYILSHSRWGRAWYALRDDPLAAQACGISQTKYRILAFAISAGIGGVAGAFFIAKQVNINPNNFSFVYTSVMPLCMVVIGGEGSIVGVIAGAILLAPLAELIRDLVQRYNELFKSNLSDVVRFIIFGAILILAMKFFPKGLFPMRMRKPRHAVEPDDVDDDITGMFSGEKIGEGGVVT